MATVKLQEVYKYYGNNKKAAVENFNLEISDKEFVVFVGPSGCGKSTTLRMIAGLEEISKGTIEIDGRVVNDLEPVDRDIAMVFQSYALYPHKSVYDNMAFGLKMKKISVEVKDRHGNYVLDKKGNRKIKYRRYTNAEIDEKVIEAAKILEITEFLHRKPRELSGGQRQRVAIGRAIVRNPKVFLMDEPLSNLDAKLRTQMRGEIVLLRKKIQTTFVYVTHDQVEAMTLGDRIVVMKDGFINQVGTPIEVFQHPANLFVASFIGSPQMNFIDGKLFRLNNGYNIEVFGKRYELNQNLVEVLASKNALDQEVVVGIRPEHFIFTNDDNDTIKGKLVISEMMGTEYLLYVEVCNTKLTIKVPILSSGEAIRNMVTEKKDINFSFDIDSIHLFDKESGTNLI